MTNGARRAGRNISDRFRRSLPALPESNAETLAQIIDKETGATAMLEALEAALKALQLAADNNPWIRHDGYLETVVAAIRKAKGESA